VNVATDRLQAFVDLVRRLRAVQAEYARTIDARLRREKERLEFEVDAAAGWLAADLAAHQFAETHVATTEGGAA
jgi:hypothetical protein